MWIKNTFGVIKPVIGMVHIDALPGTVLYNQTGGLNKIIEHAKQDYVSLVEGGINAVIFCNENDKPYSKEVDPHIVSAMTLVIREVVGNKVIIPFGVDIQWDAKASLAVASMTNASFIRGIVSGTYCGDLGFFTPDTEDILKYRHQINADHVKILTNINPEFSESLDRRSLELRIMTISKSTLVDGICVSGIMAGVATSYEMLKDVKKLNGDFPIIANTGINFDNINQALEYADACVVATCLKVNGNSRGRIDVNNVKKLMAKLKKETK